MYRFHVFQWTTCEMRGKLGHLWGEQGRRMELTDPSQSESGGGRRCPLTRSVQGYSRLTELHGSQRSAPADTGRALPSPSQRQPGPQRPALHTFVWMAPRGPGAAINQHLSNGIVDKGPDPSLTLGGKPRGVGFCEGLSQWEVP